MGQPDFRRNLILQILQETPSISVADLAQRLHVTTTTIRRDVTSLANEGIISHEWGKISRMPNQHFPNISNRSTLCQSEKAYIAKAAVRLLAPNDIIILDSGTTIQCFAHSIPSDMPLSIVTNSLSLAHIFTEKAARVQYTSGFMEKDHLSLVGSDCEEYLKNVKVAKAFLGTSSFNMQTMRFSTFSPLQSSVKRAMVAAAEKVYILLDRSKISSLGINTFASISDISGIVTCGSTFSPENEQRIRAENVEIIYAETE